MAPVSKSGVKRQQVAAAKAPAKDAKKARKAVVDPNQPLIDAVEAADSTISDSCKAMLIAMLPMAFVPKDMRDANQTRLVAMLHEVIESVKKQKQEALNVEEQSVETANASMEKLVAAVAQAEEAARVARELTATKKAEAADAQAALQAKNEPLKAACEAQKSGDAALDEATAEHKLLSDAIHGPLRLLCSSEEWEAAKDGDSCKTLMDLVKKLANADESLLLSVPACMKKAPSDRGDFDKMVINSVEKSLSDKVAELTTILEAGASGKAERAAAVEAAQREVEVAKTSRKEATDALSAATAAEKVAADAVVAAKGAVKSFDAELGKVQAARDAKQAELDTFLKHNVARFTELEGKESAALQAGA